MIAPAHFREVFGLEAEIEPGIEVEIGMSYYSPQVYIHVYSYIYAQFLCVLITSMRRCLP
ncbi:MAG: hypothetical protein COA84_06460 [Robiginitomaculum sp.]|nr:MAG: hypothetical protein COA84_06460 [Robiginitomaculum sp.]